MAEAAGRGAEYEKLAEGFGVASGLIAVRARRVDAGAGGRADAHHADGHCAAGKRPWQAFDAHARAVCRGDRLAAAHHS